jgi:hypothetical protein
VKERRRKFPSDCKMRNSVASSLYDLVPAFALFRKTLDRLVKTVTCVLLSPSRSHIYGNTASKWSLMAHLHV